MKKAYKKPVILVENFELSQHIASCTLNVRGMKDILDCYAVYSESNKYAGIKLFADGGPQCEAPAESFCTYNMADATFSSF